jgi:hypothetical protein
MSAPGPTAAAAGSDKSRPHYTTLAKTLSAIQENDLRLQLEAQLHTQGQGHNPLYPPMLSGLAQGLGFSPEGEEEARDAVTPVAGRAPSGSGVADIARGLSSWSQVAQRGGGGGSGGGSTGGGGSQDGRASQNGGAGQDQGSEGGDSNRGRGSGQGQNQNQNAREGLLSRGRLRGLTGDGILNWKAWDNQGS